MNYDVSELSVFLNNLNQAIKNDIFVRLTLSEPLDQQNDMRKIIVRLIFVRNDLNLGFTFRQSKKDITKNFSVREGITHIRNYAEDQFRVLRLFTTENDYHLERNKKSFSLKILPPQFISVPDRSHDKQKNRPLDPLKKEFLYFLGITDSQGKVLAKSQDKFKQINHFISLLTPRLGIFKELNAITVADMGSGKGYLTFALYDYLSSVLKLDVEMTGVEMRKEMVEFCNDAAKQCRFSRLGFVQNTIEEYPVHSLDLLVALHACDTATDEAIAKGIRAGAKIIVVAPCCHHQIRKDMEKSKGSHPLKSITQYGIFLERQSEMITDTIRAHILEYFGYKVNINEFISDAHTHKNILIIGEYSGISEKKKMKALENIKHLKKTFGIMIHALEKKLELNF